MGWMDNLLERQSKLKRDFKGIVFRQAGIMPARWLERGSDSEIHSGSRDQRIGRLLLMHKKKTYVIIAFACFVIAACSDQRYEYFSNGIEVKQSIQAKQGWIPDWFPVTAKEIQVQYDVDTNCRWFRFKLDKEAKKAFITNFRPLSGDEAKNIKVSAPRSAEWWFKGLIQAQPADAAALHADIYLRDDVKIPEKAYLAISKTDDSIFLWIER